MIDPSKQNMKRENCNGQFVNGKPIKKSKVERNSSTIGQEGEENPKKEVQCSGQRDRGKSLTPVTTDTEMSALFSRRVVCSNSLGEMATFGLTFQGCCIF